MPPRREVVDPPLAERPKRGRFYDLSPTTPGPAHLAPPPRANGWRIPRRQAMPRYVTFPREPRRSVSRAAAKSAFTPHAAYTRRRFHPSQDRNPTIQGNIPPQNRARRTRRGVGALRTLRTINLSSGTGNASEGLYEGNAAIWEWERVLGDIGMGTGRGGGGCRLAIFPRSRSRARECAFPVSIPP